MLRLISKPRTTKLNGKEKEVLFFGNSPFIKDLFRKRLLDSNCWQMPRKAEDVPTDYVVRVLYIVGPGGPEVTQINVRFTPTSSSTLLYDRDKHHGEVRGKNDFNYHFLDNAEFVAGWIEHYESGLAILRIAMTSGPEAFPHRRSGDI